jgi:spermidine/putrescine transport system ATP-binding protein
VNGATAQGCHAAARAGLDALVIPVSAAATSLTILGAWRLPGDTLDFAGTAKSKHAGGESTVLADIAAVEARGVTKIFGTGQEGVRALDDVSVAIRQNEFFTLLGPSGCGKTTLLRLIAGFEQPTSGEILLKGSPVEHLPPYQRAVNTVFQSYALFPHMTVAQNISFGLEMRGAAKEKVGSVVEEMLALVKMTGLGGRRPSQLSGGQQQRVALARALANHPEVLLLDEPLSALDLKLRQEMRSELKNLQRRTGITFVFVTHDQEEALTLSDRVVVMSHGKALQIDSGTKIYEAPNCREVAEFIGTMNLFPGVMGEVTQGHARIEAGALGRFDVPVAADAPALGAPVSVAIRPEKINLHWTAPDAAANALAGRLNAKAYFGDRSHYFVEVAGMDKLIAVARQNADRAFTEADAIGTAVWMTWKPEAASLLTE